MLFNQMRIRYNKDSWLVSSYIAEFFRMCGFAVNEEKVDYEIKNCKPTEVNDNEEIIINTEHSELNKQLLEETINSYLIGIIDVTKLQPLIDIYVDFSIYEFVMWIEYYCKFESLKDVLNKNRKIINSIETIESDNNEYMKFALLYCKYKVNLISKYNKYYASFYDSDELTSECKKLINDFANFKISGTVLICLILEVSNNAPIDRIVTIENIKKEILKHNKALYFNIMLKAYFLYESQYNESIKICNILRKEEPNNIIFIWNYIIVMRSNKTRDEEKSEEIISNIRYLLKLLDKKEKEIPLNPKELRLRVLATIYLVEECYLIDEVFERLNSNGKRIRPFDYMLEKYSSAIDKSNFENILDLKEFSVQSPNSIIKDSLNESIRLAIIRIDMMFSKYKVNERKEEFVKNMLNMYPNLDTSGII